MPSKSDNELMGRVGLDTTEWKKGITDINTGIKHIETGFQATAALMDDWGSSSDGLKMRLESLNDKLALQKKKLDILKKAYEEEVKKSGASSKAAENLAKQMYNAGEEIKRTKKSIEKYSNAETEATKRTREHIEALQKSGEKYTELGGKISSIGGKMTAGITAPVIAAGAAVYKFSSDLTEAINKADATFGYQAADIQEWSKAALDNMGMARQTALDAVSLYGDMATSMGLGKKSAAEMSMELVSLSADLSSFKNVSLDISQNALKGIFTGETESLKNLGIVMTETELKAYAMAKGFEKTYSDMSQSEKVQLRYQYVLEKSKNAIGDYSRTSGEAAGQMRKLPEALKESATSFRENVEPVITPVIETLNKAIVSFGKLDDSTKQTIVTVAGIAAAAGPVISVGGKFVSTAGKVKKAIAAIKNTKLIRSLNDTAFAMKNVDKSSSGAANGIKNIAKSAKSANPYILAVVASLGLVSAEISRSIRQYETEIDEFYNNEIKKGNVVHDSKINRYRTEIENVESSLEQQTASINNFYDNELKRIEENLKVKKESCKKSLELLEKEYQASIKSIDTDAMKQANALQEKIDAIDALTAVEEEKEKERKNAEKLDILQENILNARTLTEREEAQKAYSQFVSELEREKTLTAREEQKNKLKDEINAINQSAEIQKNKAKEEFDAKKQSLDNQLKLLDSYMETETAKIENQRQLRLENLQTEMNRRLEILKKGYEDAIKVKEEYEAKLEAQKEEEKKEVHTFKGFLKKFAFDYIPKNAAGTNDWQGGLTWVHEQGGEIINLPRGTQIIPHDVSMEMARSYGRQAAISNTTNNSTTTNNSYHNSYGPQQKVTEVNIAGHTVAKVIEPGVSEIAAIRAIQRRRAGHAYK